MSLAEIQAEERRQKEAEERQRQKVAAEAAAQGTSLNIVSAGVWGSRAAASAVAAPRSLADIQREDLARAEAQAAVRQQQQQQQRIAVHQPRPPLPAIARRCATVTSIF